MVSFEPLGLTHATTCIEHVTHVSVCPDRCRDTQLGYTHQVYGVWRHALAEDFRPGVGLDLWELELGVVGVHGMDLLFCRGPQHLDNLHQLVHAAFTCSTTEASQCAAANLTVA